jgi:hypothetical protein
LTSELGVGSIFSVTIPLRLDAAGASTPTQPDLVND